MRAHTRPLLIWLSLCTHAPPQRPFPVSAARPTHVSYPHASLAAQTLFHSVRLPRLLHNHLLPVPRTSVPRGCCPRLATSPRQHLSFLAPPALLVPSAPPLPTHPPSIPLLPIRPSHPRPSRPRRPDHSVSAPPLVVCAHLHRRLPAHSASARSSFP
ncbi:hypothetical protein B0H14DRAFT_2963886 [Mycena olivaceomarginata]|nr:hypothetical protein B0H14DRAFT_2963886 [Mycena olivaceomarginata]